MFSHPSLSNKLILPKVLKTEVNGKLPSKVLTAVSSSSLVTCAFEAWCALVHYARMKEQIFLSGASFYRTYDQQLSLQSYRSVYAATPSNNEPTFFDIATPGISSHGWGLSIDVGLMNGKFPSMENTTLLDDTTSNEWIWLSNNLEKFGFGFEYNDQPWHIVYKSGDLMPNKVKFFINSTRWNTINFKKGLFLRYAFTSNKKEMSVNNPGKTDQIQYVQSVLLHGRKFAGMSVQITGVFDIATESGIQRLQEWYDITPTGIIDQDTWSAIDFEAAGMIGKNIY